MDFFRHLKAKYAPEQNMRDFEAEIERIESHLFKHLPWALFLREEDANMLIEYVYLLRHGGVN